MGAFGAAQGGQKAPSLSKICHTYPIMKLDSHTLLKEDSKTIQITWHIPWVLLTSAFFHWKSSNFVISRNKDTNCILIVSKPFLESLRVVLINMAEILLSAKLATLHLLKYFEIMVMTTKFLSTTSPIKFFHVTQIILKMWSCDESLVTLAFLREVVRTSIFLRLVLDKVQ